MKLIDIDNQRGRTLTEREERLLRKAVIAGIVKDECGGKIEDFEEFLDLSGNFCCDETTYLEALATLE